MFSRLTYLREKLSRSRNAPPDGNTPLKKNGGAPPSNWRSKWRSRHRLPGDLIPGSYDAIMDTQARGSTCQPSGHFMGAHNFKMYGTKLTEHNYFLHGRMLFDVLGTVSTPEAALGSGARHPAPRCHPGSRKIINKRLEEWLLNPGPHRRMTWLFGPAGVGKSAVAQTFGELAHTHNRLGATFFFSALDESHKRSESLRVIPTLAHQLAVHDPQYKHAITHQLAIDPLILHATLRAQFQKLIIEPFSLGQRSPEMKPHLIILDGLDECDGEEAQCELIELINAAAQRNDLPLIWLICSRPESHIKYTFSQLEYSYTCERQELIIDEEARADVERFLRDSFKEIHNRYRSAIAIDINATWPSEEVFDKISRASSGYFNFASIVIRVVGDRGVGNPESQLVSLLSMLQGLDDVVVNNPLQALDIFYSRILSRVPEPVLPTAIQLLGICAHAPSHSRAFMDCAEHLWLFLRIERGYFYSALEKLHSIVRVPPPEDVRSENLSFYHKSFMDYLVNQRRSRKFFLPTTRVTLLLGINGLYWYGHILACTSPGLVGRDERSHSQSVLKKWLFGGEVEEHVLHNFSMECLHHCEEAMGVAGEVGTDFFEELCKFNFSLLGGGRLLPCFLKLAHLWDWTKAPTPGFVRTGVFDGAVDPKLLRHLSVLTNGKRIRPIDVTSRERFAPLKPGDQGYFIVGDGLNSCLVCCRQETDEFTSMFVLNALSPPTANQIVAYRYEEER